VKPLAVVVLAAGKGTRMPGTLPKVLHPLGGEPMVNHVLRTVRALGPERIALVVGHRGEEVRGAVAAEDLAIVTQSEQRGTGHAVLCAEEALAGWRGTLLVVYGDVPLLRRETLLELCELHDLEGNAASILSATVDEPAGYGRLVRDDHGRCVGIVEQRNLAFEQERIPEINSGIIAFDSELLFPALHQVRPDDRTEELYLTDVIGLLCASGRRVGTYHLNDPTEILGVNTLEQLSMVERAHVCRLRNPTGGCELCDAAARADDPEALASGRSLLLGAGARVCLKVASRPFNNGHLLVFPRRHLTCFPNLDAEERAELAAWLRTAEALLARAYRMDALNTGTNSGVGGHLAFHLIPRWSGDLNYLPLLAGLKLVPESPRGTWERLWKEREGVR